MIHSSEKRPRVGFIGIGEMGRPLASNLIGAGFRLTAYDLRREPLIEIEKEGASIASSPSDLAANSDVVITILPSAKSVRSSILEDGGVLESIEKGHSIIEMSTIDVPTTLELERNCKEKQVGFIDAPIAGTPDRAMSRDILVLASGEKETVNNCMDVLKALAKTVEYVGKAGNGKIVKLTNNLLIAIHKIAAIEAICFALKQGIEPDILFKVVMESTGDSRVFDRFCGAVIGRNPEIASKHSWHLKDLGLIQDLSKETDSPLLMGNLSLDVIRAASNATEGVENFQSLVDYYKKNMKLNL